MAAPKVAMKECVDCHRRFPANEMRSWTVEKRTGSSIGVYGLGKKGGKPRGSVRAHYRKSQVWICNTCYNRFGRKVGRFFETIFIILFLYIIIGLILMFIDQGLGVCKGYDSTQLFCSIFKPIVSNWWFVIDLLGMVISD